jgi:hypothetical protein
MASPSPKKVTAPTKKKSASDTANPYYARMTATFQRYLPEKLHKVGDALVTYRGKEEEFMKAVRRKYGPADTASDDEGQEVVLPASPPRPRVRDVAITSDYTTRHHDREKVERLEAAARRAVADEERRRFYDVTLKVRDSLSAALALERERLLQAHLEVERRRSQEEVTALLRQREEVAAEAAHQKRINALVRKEVDARVAHTEARRRARTAIERQFSSEHHDITTAAARKQRQELNAKKR